jgi:hypothetical protein
VIPFAVSQLFGLAEKITKGVKYARHRGRRRIGNYASCFVGERC